LHSLDALRTIAALAVVIEHWPQHFFWIEGFRQPLSASPFYEWLSGVYIHGASAVTFFFCLSGFVFYWLYGDEVHARNVSFERFATLRLSRLYPLHFVTLVLMIPLLIIAHTLLHFDFLYYQNDDLYHFGLNLAFVQTWGFQKGYSWNGPSWSISVEIALYILFFIACLKSRPHLMQTLFLVAICLAFSRFSIILSSAVAFFCGGSTYYFYVMATRHRTKMSAYTAVGLTIIVWLLMGRLSDSSVESTYVEVVRNALPSGIMSDFSARAVEIFCRRVREFALYPTLIFASAFLETCTPSVKWHLLGEVGNISFGVYLLHFPLQLVAASTALWFSMPSDVFTRSSTFIAFFAVLLSAAVASYYLFERPAMFALRNGTRGINRAALHPT